MRIITTVFGVTWLLLLIMFPRVLAAQQSVKITAMALSPDGTKIALVGDNGYQAIWDIATNKQLVIFNVPTKRVDTVTWSPDSAKVATASALDGIIRIWNAENGKLMAELQSDLDPDGYAFVAWSPDGKKLATGIFSENASIKVWNTAEDNYSLLANLGNSVFFSIAWSPDSGKLAVAGFFSASIVDDLSKNNFRAIGPAGRMFSVEWSPDGNQIAIGGAEIITVVNATNGKEIFKSVESQSAIDVVHWSSDGSYLATANHASTIKIWNAKSWTIVKELDRKHDAIILGPSMTWSHDGGQLLFLGNVQSNPTVKGIANSFLQIAVPIVSLDRLAEITRLCAKSGAQQALISQIQSAYLSNFINLVKQQSKDQIPPACAADLIAIAEALQKQP